MAGAGSNPYPFEAEYTSSGVTRVKPRCTGLSPVPMSNIRTSSRAGYSPMNDCGSIGSAVRIGTTARDIAAPSNSTPASATAFNTKPFLMVASLCAGEKTRGAMLHLMNSSFKWDCRAWPHHSRTRPIRPHAPAERLCPALTAPGPSYPVPDPPAAPSIPSAGHPSPL